MDMNKEFCLSDYDLGWFCYDNNGKVAVLFSNGTTAVLPQALMHYDYLYNYFYTRFNCDEKANWENGELKSFTDAGLLVYDTDLNSIGTYSVCNNPLKSCHISTLPKSIADRLPKFEGVFSTTITIPIQPDVINLAKIKQI